MKEGERQVAPTIDGIRRDHVARYEWAARYLLLEGRKTVIDFACGIGYGSKMLAEKALLDVLACDIDEEALAYGKNHYRHPRVKYARRDASDPGELTPADAAVCFETIEHVQDPRPLLRSLREAAPELLASVPNEDVFPYLNYAFHYRHYTKGQFEALLNECGWGVKYWLGQEGDESEVEQGDITEARTMIAVCGRIESAVQAPMPDADAKPASVPEHVAILGLGPSLDQYTNFAKRLGGRHQYCDETWAINALGSVIQCDRIFHMDDVRIQELRAQAQPQSNTAAMLAWMKTTDIPIVTSRPHPDYPTTEPFPLIEVLNAYPYGYFNSTAAYAVAYAIWLGVKKISLFGCDFTYPKAHDAEKGRACVEFWLGMGAARRNGGEDNGLLITVPKNTTLLDALHTQRERFYGYDTLDLKITRNAVGRIEIEFTERAAEDIPTAEEVEAAYDHDAHPNALVKGAAHA